MAAPEASIREKPRDYQGRIAERNLPMPDSARLTTQLLDRAISGFREVLEVRLADMDKAILMAVKQMKKIPLDATAKSDQQRADIDRQIFALREFIMSQIENIRDVNMEKFETVNSRFLERDIRIEAAAQEGRISLDVALAAVKEVASDENKAHLATQKQIDAMVQLMTASTKSLEDKISDLRTRLDRGEGRDTRSTEVRSEKRLDIGSLIQAIAVMVTIVGLVFVVIRGG